MCHVLDYDNKLWLWEAQFVANASTLHGKTNSYILTTALAFPCRIMTPCQYMLQHGLTRVGTLIVATIYLQLIQNKYMFRSFTVPQCSHQHCVHPVASDVEDVGYL